MASKVEADTPLFMQDETDFISPTRPLHYSMKKRDRDPNVLPRHASELQTNYLPHSSYAMTKESSEMMSTTTKELPIPRQTFAFPQRDFNSDNTPVLNNNDNVPIEDILTPKVNNGESYMTESVYSEDSSDEDSCSEGSVSYSYGPIEIGGEPFAGLGLEGVNDNMSVSSNVEIAKTAMVISSKSSPVRAIRTSAIVNGKGNLSPFSNQSFFIENIDNNFQKYNNEQSQYSLISGDFQGAQQSHSNSPIPKEPKSSIIDIARNTMTEIPKESQSSVVNMSRNNSSNIQRNTTLKKNTELKLDNENFAYLFIIAIHSFNSKTLDNPDDISICLSFEKDDIAFVHTVDESGWGEVTIVRNRQRGWVPFNYFSDTVKCKNIKEPGDHLKCLIETRSPLQTLLSASARFLLDCQSTSSSDDLNAITFNFQYINLVKDGVKNILEKTECVSRSNELVRQRPLIRKARKQLLADWYNLMIKADYYKHSTIPKNIQTLTELLYEVLDQAFVFFRTWSKERIEYEKEEHNKESNGGEVKGAEGSVYLRHHAVQYLTEAPTAMIRLQELYDMLFLYAGLILGRLDLIEHNPSGAEMLEAIVHQIIILLRELLYISKSCSSIIQDKFQYAYDDTVHKNLDPLLSLVSELVSCVKLLVVDTLREGFGIQDAELLVREDLYHHTDQGQRLIFIVSSLTTLIANTVSGCNSYLRLIGDFQLSKDRKFSDLQEMKITPEKFISHCSEGLTKNIDEEKLAKCINKAIQEQNGAGVCHRELTRFSTIRAGNEKKMGFTIEGTQFLQELFMERKPFDRESKFEPFKLNLEEGSTAVDELDDINNKDSMSKQLMFGKDGSLIGASFKALVYRLTNEMNKPDQFFTASFLLNFRSFGTTVDLIDSLIARFDLNDKSIQYELHEKNGQYSSRASRLKNRRKLVCKVFQYWMESYWNYSSDYMVLPTLINFFNEGLSSFLPIEAKTLTEIAARLCTLTPHSKEFKKDTENLRQLHPLSIQHSRTCSIYSELSSSSSTSHRSSTVDQQMLEEYDLTHIPSQNRNSMSLPLPVLNYGTCPLLSKRNIQDMERLLISYRLVTGYSTSAMNKSPNDLNAQNDTRLLILEWNELVTSDLRVSQPLAHNDMNLVDVNPLELAKQLTLIESQLFMAVGPFELLDENYLPKKHHLGLAPNVNAIVNFTNQLSNYVIECILYPNISLKERTSRLQGWLKIALAASHFRNFNSLAAIMTALQNHAITRLQSIWDGLGDKEIDLYDYLARVVHPNNNFKIYRKKLKKYTEENKFGEEQHSKTIVPVVPFFNLFLQDLTFINEGNANSRDDDKFRPYTLVNIDKYFKITKTLNIINFFQVDYESTAQGTDKLISFFNIGDQIDEESTNIKPIPLLQEFILCEFWRVNTLFKENKDRGYQLSIALKPR